MPDSLKSPIFSIVIPTLNEEKFLPSLLGDLKKQTFTDFEVVVSDGRSADKTLALAQSYAFVKPFLSPRVNVAYQRNFGAKKARGRFLLFVDADTRLKPSFLKVLNRKLNEKPKTDFFTCFINNPRSRPSEKMVVNLLNFILEASKILEMPSAFGAFIGCRRRVFLRSGGFDPKIAFSEDTEFIRRLYKKGYRFNLFKEPRFCFSLRRFRKEGTFRLLRQYAKLNLKVIFEGFSRNKPQSYLMLGGSYYQSRKPSSKFIEALERFLKNLKKPKNRPRL